MADYTIQRVQPVHRAVWPAKRPAGSAQSGKSSNKPAKSFRAAFDTFTYKSESGK